MSVKHWSTKLEAIGACSEAVEWARTQPSFHAAWAKCERPDWMLWLLGERLPDDPTAKARRYFSQLPTAFAKRALKHAGNQRPVLAPIIRDLERWAKSDPRVTLEVLASAGAAAWASAGAAAGDAAGVSAGAAAWAAAGDAAGVSARAAAWAAAWAAACAAAWAAAGDAAGASARASERRAQGRLIRKFYPAPRMPKPKASK